LLCCEASCDMTPESRRAVPDIDGDIEYPPPHAPDKLVLGEWRDLEMHSANGVFSKRKRLVILHPVQRACHGRKERLVECLNKVAAFVTISFRREHEDFRNGQSLEHANPDCGALSY